MVTTGQASCKIYLMENTIKNAAKPVPFPATIA